MGHLNYWAIVGCLLSCGNYIILDDPCVMCIEREMHGHLCAECAKGMAAMMELMDQADKAAAESPE